MTKSKRIVYKIKMKYIEILTAFINRLYHFKRTSLNAVILLDFSLTVKAAPHECVIRTSQP